MTKQDKVNAQNATDADAFSYVQELSASVAAYVARANKGLAKLRSTLSNDTKTCRGYRGALDDQIALGKLVIKADTENADSKTRQGRFIDSVMAGFKIEKRADARMLLGYLRVIGLNGEIIDKLVHDEVLTPEHAAPRTISGKIKTVPGYVKTKTASKTTRTRTPKAQPLLDPKQRVVVGETIQTLKPKTRDSLLSLINPVLAGCKGDKVKIRQCIVMLSDAL